MIKTIITLTFNRIKASESTLVRVYIRLQYVKKGSVTGFLSKCGCWDGFLAPSWRVCLLCVLLNDFPAQEIFNKRFWRLPGWMDEYLLFCCTIQLSLTSIIGKFRGEKVQKEIKNLFVQRPTPLTRMFLTCSWRIFSWLRTKIEKIKLELNFWVFLSSQCCESDKKKEMQF